MANKGLIAEVTFAVVVTLNRFIGGLVNELKLSEPGPGSPSVSSWPRDRLAGLSA